MPNSTCGSTQEDDHRFTIVQRGLGCSAPIHNATFSLVNIESLRAVEVNYIIDPQKDGFVRRVQVHRLISGLW
jgi:hypothetical protein